MHELYPLHCRAQGCACRSNGGAALHNRIWNAGVRAAMENGGVINDHHGIGLKLSRLMKEQYGPAMQVFEGLKKSLDPNGIMNPYKLGV